MLGPKLAEFEQVAAAGRAKSSRENPLGQIVLLCASSEAVLPSPKEENADS